MKQKNKYILLSILFILVVIPVFGYLNYLPIRLWDESRIAINAMEMYWNNNFIVTHYMGKADLWNTKPPMLIWLQVTSMHLFGLNEFALRLPSAIANFFILVLIIIFSEKYLKNIWIAPLWVLVFISSQGLVNIHSSRTADYDTLLSFVNFVYLISFYLYIENKNKRYLYYTFVFITLSFLTKGIAGLMFLPSLLLYILYKKEFFNILKNKHFYIGILMFLFIGIGYYLIRELNSSGYIKAVFSNEVGGRFMQVTENHNESFWFYFNDLINNRFINLYLFIPFGIIIAFFTKNKSIKQFSIFLLFSIIPFLLIISIAKTKLAWYNMPTRSLLSFFVAFSLYSISKFIYDYKILKNKKILSISIIILFIVIVLKKPYTGIIKNTYKPVEYAWDINKFAISYFLRDAVNNKIDLNNTAYLNTEYNPQNLFYIKILQKKGVNIKVININDIKYVDKIIIPKSTDLKIIEGKYLLSPILEKYNITLYNISEK